MLISIMEGKTISPEQLDPKLIIRASTGAFEVRADGTK